MTRSRTYSQLDRLPTFEERFDYLVLNGVVGQSTFGFDRWVNQYFYTSRAWRDARDVVILRDNGCDLGVPGYEIGHELLVHHMNPVTAEDLESGKDWILDPEFLVTTCYRTHNAIHFGDATLLRKPHVDRTPGDTSLW